MKIINRDGVLYANVDGYIIELRAYGTPPYLKAVVPHGICKDGRKLSIIEHHKLVTSHKLFEMADRIGANFKRLTKDMSLPEDDFAIRQKREAEKAAQDMMYNTKGT